MRTRFLVIAAVTLLLPGLGAGCKKQGGDKQADDDDGMKSRGMGAMAAMDGEDGMDGMDGMEVAAGMEAMEPERPVVEPPRADAPAEDKEAVAEGILTEVKGTVEVRRAGKDEFEAVAKDAQLFAKDALRVGKDGEATLTLWDNSSVELPPETAITVNASDAIKDPAPSIAVMAGAARFEVNPRTEGQGPVSIFTPSAVVNVQGTTLVVGVGLSGAARVGVEVGKVDLVAVAKADAPAVEIPQGKVIVVPFGQVPAVPAAYQAASAGWDEWLEAQDKQAADKAAAVADIHADQVDALQKDAEALDQASSQADEAGAKLAADAEAAEKKADANAYVAVQPKIAVNLETQVAARGHRMLVDSRMLAHAYLLGLMRARIKGGVYKVPAAALQRVETAYDRSYQIAHARRLRALERYRADRPRLKRWQKAYYIHHPRGRAVAPKLQVVVPPFYMKAKLRPALRPAPVRIVGYNRPIYRRPVYRGKFQPYRPVAVAVRPGVRPGVRPAVVPVFRPKAWHNQDQWRKVHQARVVKQAPQREVWRKAVIQKRQERWVKRPDTRSFQRHPRAPMGIVPGPMGPHDPGPGIHDPHGMGPGPMLRDPHDMGPHGPGPMLRDPHDMGPQGRGPMLRDGRDMGPPPGMPSVEDLRRRRMERRGMGGDR